MRCRTSGVSRSLLWQPWPGWGGALCKLYYKRRYHTDDHCESHQQGKATSNVAEYMALILGLHSVLRKLASQVGTDPGQVYLEVIGDSKLVVQQVEGKMKAINPTMQQLCVVAQSLIGKFSCCGYYHVPREENKDADTIAQRA